MNRFAGQKLRHRCREQTYGHRRVKAAGFGGAGVMNWAIGIDMYTLMCIKLMTNKNLLYKKVNKIKLKNLKKKESCTAMFIAALFTIVRTWKQPKCPSTDEWIKKMWHIYTMGYYSAIKRNKIELFVVR